MLKTTIAVAAVLLFSACNRNPEVYVERGDALFREGKFSEAAINYRKAIQQDAELGRAYYGLGLAEMRERRLPEAFAAFQTATRLLPDYAEAKGELANVYMVSYFQGNQRSRRHRDQAEALSDELLLKNKDFVPGLRIKGAITLSDNKPADALPYFRRAYEIAPSDAEVVQGLVLSLLGTGAGPEAERIGLDAIGRNKKLYPVYNILHKHYSLQGRRQDAQSILERKVASDPSNAEHLLDLATHYARVKQLPEMNATLQRVLDRSKFPQGYLLAGDFHSRNGNHPDALQMFEAGLRVDKANAQVYHKRMLGELIAMRDFDRARKAADEAIVAHPEDEELETVRALILLESSDKHAIESAAETLQKLVRKNQADATMRYHLGRAHMEKGNLAAAQAEFQQAVKLRQRRYAEPLLALAGIAMEQGQYRESLRYADEVLNFSAENLQAQIMRAASLRSLGRYDESRTIIQSALRKHENDARLDVELAFVQLMDRNPAEAERLFRKHYQPGQRDIRALAGLTEVYAGQRQFQKAVSLLEAERKLRPESRQIHLLFADILSRAGNTAGAIAEFESIAASSPPSPVAHIRVAQLQMRQGALDKAVKHFELAAGLMPRNAEPLMMAAEAYVVSGAAAQARPYYERVLKIQPGNPAALNNLATILAENKEGLDRALEMSKRAVQTVPNEVNFLDTLGWIYVQKGLAAEALQIYRGLTAKNVDNPTIHYHHGVAFLKAGDRAKAKLAFEKALALKPRPEAAARIKKALEDGLS